MTETTSVLPTFFVIGASKSGTTSLHYYFAAHPEIVMTEPKEPHLMIGPGWRDRLWGYGELFGGDSSIRGEASPGYAVMPRNEDAPRNIAEVVPRARLVYLVRDPVERAVAQYAQHVILGMETRPIDEALDPDDPYCEYVAASRYATVVESYLDHFGPEQMLVMDYSLLRSDRRGSLARLFAHVGADPGFWDQAALERDYNVRSQDNLMLPGPLKRSRYGRVNAWSKRSIPDRFRTPLVQGLKSMIGRRVTPSVPGPVQARLADALASEADRLRAITGSAFSGWQI